MKIKPILLERESQSPDIGISYCKTQQRNPENPKPNDGAVNMADRYIIDG